MDVKLIPSTIIESLGRAGAQEFDELFNRLQKRYSGLNEADFTRVLMEMELQGLVRITKMARGKRRIELA